MINLTALTYENAKEGGFSLRDYYNGFGEEMTKLRALEKIIASCANHADEETLLDEDVATGLSLFLRDTIETIEKGLERIDNEILAKMREELNTTKKTTTM